MNPARSHLFYIKLSLTFSIVEVKLVKNAAHLVLETVTTAEKTQIQIHFGMAFLFKMLHIILSHKLQRRLYDVLKFVDVTK